MLRYRADLFLQVKARILGFRVWMKSKRKSASEEEVREALTEWANDVWSAVTLMHAHMVELDEKNNENRGVIIMLDRRLKKLERKVQKKKAKRKMGFV